MDKVLMVPLILKEGGFYKINDTDWTGYSQGTLEQMGIDRKSLKKAAKMGLCKEFFVRTNSEGTMVKVFAVPASGQIVI